MLTMAQMDSKIDGWERADRARRRTVCASRERRAAARKVGRL